MTESVSNRKRKDAKEGRVMESPIVRIAVLAAAMAMVLALVAVSWTLFNQSVPSRRPGDVDPALITNQVVCESLGHTWSTSKCT